MPSYGTANILYILGSLVPKNRIESANALSLAAIFDDTEMKRPYTKQLYELIYKHTRIKLDPQVFLGMVARAQTVDTRPFFFASGLGTRLITTEIAPVPQNDRPGSYNIGENASILMHIIS